MDFKLLSLLLHFSFLYLKVLSLIECSSYMCKPSEMNFDDETCAYYDQLNNIYYSKECKDDNICNNPNSLNMTCQRNERYFGVGGPGEKCKSNFDCNLVTTSSCTNGICQGIPTGQICNLNFYCMPGNYCLNQKCTPQIEIGSKGCLYDTDCVNNGACNVTSATNPQANSCLQVYSFEPHEPVGNCQNQQSALCKYLTCAKNGDSDIYYCTNLMTAANSPAQPCSGIPLECASKPDNFFNPPFIANAACNCGYNADRQAYCGLYNGDGPGVRLLSLWAKWYSSSAVLKCNTANRNSFNCMKDYWDESSFKELYYWYTYFSAYNLIVGSENCVINTMAFQYAYASKLDGHGDFNDGDDSAQFLGISIFIGFIFY